MPVHLDEEKRLAAGAAALRVRRGMRVALGTGSTAELAIRALAARRDEASDLTCVASSPASEALARSLGLSVRPPMEGDRYEVMLDGADEVDPQLQLTKGAGGALLREKLLARHTEEVVIAVDHTKLVEHLGQRSPIPVEVVPFARPVLLSRFRERGWSPVLRLRGEGTALRTDNGNEILDLHLPEGVADPAGLDRELHELTGVVETGLFLGIARRVFVGMPEGTVDERTAPASGRSY
jgi:ribose 5-phosphate isomerase A